MEGLTSAFTSGLGFESKEPTVQSHSSLHKVKGSGLSSQEERRRRNLQLQKEKREDYLAQVRKIVESDDEGIEDDEEEMESSSYRQRRKKGCKRHMANQLMLSEWMVDVPPDLDDNWFMVACPRGRRCLVTTNGGTTRAFRKNGYCFKRFPSHLPAGKRRNRSGDSKPVILDCVFNEAEKTFYVLDVMCWMNHPVYDSDTEFRFFWLQAKFSEVPNASEISDINPFAFIPLPCYPCSKSTMESVMGREMPFKADLDGILFYHKQTHYTTGSTPLVGWLKPWMLPEVLRVSVPQKYIDSKPPEEPWKPPNVPSEMECSSQEPTNAKQTEEHAG